MLHAGEIAVKLKPEELAPFATGIVERLVPILQNMNSMPRSIVENRCPFHFFGLISIKKIFTDWEKV